MKIRLYKKNGYEDLTLRVARDENKNNLAVIGTVNDLLQVGLFDYCTAAGNKWAVIPYDGAREEDVVFSDTREDAVNAVKRLLEQRRESK